MLERRTELWGRGALPEFRIKFRLIFWMKYWNDTLTEIIMSNDVLRKQIGKFTRCFSVLLKN